ncbi:hypothetical protein J2S43_007532 [Catenuloplanes nepalensis]|uniref:Uncharacterized protein n=1 Tax=Catenuloplanes nepalensis TaxID=587533 RepID=A0ABT9N651_9ACTN|nr:hypothetical protein [Catenuloplanes nepalensis]MDP9799020.1 hypothetical protein [Catenuloplanes nepalensis]
MADRLFNFDQIRDDEELIMMLENIRQTGIAGHDELDELSGLVKAKIVRYAKRNGVGGMRARFWGKVVSLPISRSADAMLAVAGYAKVCKNRFEAFVVALDDENAGRSDFEIRQRRRPSPNGRQAA